MGLQVAERTITSDLEFLISRAVDTEKADYAVITGIQIHSWPDPATGAPAIEFVMPGSFYAVVNGEKVEFNIGMVPALTPRQAAILSSGAAAPDRVGAYLAASTVLEVTQPDPAGDPATAGPTSTQELLFKNMRQVKGVQSEHETPEWAKMYCC
jgi:hypothetical protein